MLRTTRAYLVLPHLWAVLIVLIATGTFGVIASDGEPDPERLTLLLLGMLGGQLAIGALNEWCDRHADAVAKPWKPIPSGLVPESHALAITAGGLVLMLVAGGLLGGVALLVLIAGAACGLVYNLGVKRTPLSWLPYLLALPLVPIWAWLVMDRFQPRLLWLYPLGALFIIAIHLAQALPDIAGDRRRGEHGLAVALGERWTPVVLWSAALGATALVGAGAALYGRQPVAGIVAAGLTGGSLLVALALYRRNPARIQPHLFELMTTCAVVLGCGWALAVV